MAYVEIYKAQGYLAAEMIKLYLESAGIQVKVYQESAGLVYGLTVGSLGMAKILVPENQKDEAIQLIQQMDSEDLSEDEPSGD